MVTDACRCQSHESITSRLDTTSKASLQIPVARGCVFSTGKQRKALPLTSIKNIGQERDFNRIDAPGVPPDAFEAQMMKFDSKVSQAPARPIAAKRFSADRAILFGRDLVSHWSGKP